jgi:GNAT superfamily N-acetyltransferase
MSASALSSEKPRDYNRSSFGLRSVRLRKDLGAIADLIEIAFAATMDKGGRSAIREMRMLSRLGPFVRILANLDRATRALQHGFVWIDPKTERLVGNVTVYQSELDRVWVIANVAVHPDFRRRGIAREMMKAAMDLTTQENAVSVMLQVEADNDGAKHLYQDLGFRVQRGFTRWRRRPYLDPPNPLTTMPDITLRAGREWKAEMALAEQVRPNHLGGLGWLKSTEPSAFHSSIWQHLSRILNPTTIQRLVIRDTDPSRLAASMWIESTFGASYSRVNVMVSPDQQGSMEKPLLNFATRLLADSRRGLIVEHPSDDEAATAVFREYEFEAMRHLVHMIWQPEA